MKVSRVQNKLLLALPLFLAMPVAHADLGLSLSLDNEFDRFEKNKNDDVNLRLGLGIEYRGENLNVDKTGVSYDFVNSDRYSIEAILTSNNQGFKSKDRDIFNGMSKRRDSIDIGARAIVKTDYGPVVMEVTRDVHASKGHEADIRFGGILPHKEHWTGKRELTVAALAGVKYQSKKVVDYHYGVKSSEATADRSQYSAKAATTPYVGVESQVNVNKNITLNAGLIYERRDDSIANSSITDDKDYDVIGTLGATYWF